MNTNRKPDRIQPLTGGLVLLVGSALAILNIAGLGIWFFLLVLAWAANVTLGGGLNEPMWHVVGRVQRLLADPDVYGQDSRR